MNRELSSYAFNTYGHDAKLYNGIHDLETENARLKAENAAARGLSFLAGVNWFVDFINTNAPLVFANQMIPRWCTQAIDAARKGTA